MSISYQRGEKAIVCGTIDPYKFFHGGIGSMFPGEMLLPPIETGHKCASDYGADDVHNRERVYVTPLFEAAVMYAALYPDKHGVVYEVQPLGELEDDPDCDTPGLSFAVPRAKVLRRIAIAPELRRKVLKELGIARELW